MSSRSNNSRSDGAYRADVVALSQNRVRAEQKSSQSPEHAKTSASLLSVRQHLRYKACLSLNGSCFDQFKNPANAQRETAIAVRSLLHKEFGSLRIHRHRQLLVVSHHCVEALIAGLLRVQFHARQLNCSACRQLDGGESKSTGITLSWGVGESLAEAETARKKRISADV